MLVIVNAIQGQAFVGNRQPAQPDQFVLGRHTFFDFGPPNDFYELFLVRETVTGTFIQKITLTPAANSCTMPSKAETASASLKQSVAELLGTNPCKISTKELKRELKRCKHCLVFSGANVSMQIECGAQTRIIRSSILDKDVFDPAPHTPKNTSWTMQLLQKLDQAVGQPGVMDKPMFQLPEDRQALTGSESEFQRGLAAGKYDALFKDAPDKPSLLYQAARLPAPKPSIRLLRSTPFQPQELIVPAYPGILVLAGVQGEVAFKADVDASGSTTNFTLVSGPAPLRGIVENAVKKWKFSREAANQQIEAVMEFNLNCPAR